MEINNAIKKLQRNGWIVEQLSGRIYKAMKDGIGGQYISMITQEYDGEQKVIIIDLRSPRADKDESEQMDYHGGTFCKNLTQAMRIAETN